MVQTSTQQATFVSETYVIGQIGGTTPQRNSLSELIEKLNSHLLLRQISSFNVAC